MIRQLLTFCLSAFFIFSACAQDNAVVGQAESGTPGADWETVTALGITSVRPKTDVLNAAYPGNASKVITYTITFPKAGVYNLYAKIKVGAFYICPLPEGLRS